jgi:hypothetical protein
VLASASVLIAAAVFTAMGGFAHSAGRPAGVTFAIAGGWALASAAATRLVLPRPKASLGHAPHRLATAVVVLPIAMFLWLVLFHGTYEEPYQRFGWRCLGMTLGIGALPLAGFLHLRRGVEPRRPSALGALAGGAAGAWAGVVVDLWCPLTNPAHALVGHVFPLLVLVSIGAAAGSRMLGVRRV